MDHTKATRLQLTSLYDCFLFAFSFVWILFPMTKWLIESMGQFPSWNVDNPPPGQKIIRL